MFKLVVLSALVAAVVAKPGVYHGAVEVAAPIVAKSYVAPAAVSSTYREDIISKPAVVAYAAAPVVAKNVVAPSIAVAAPVVHKAVAYSAPVAYSAHVAYSAPAVYSAPVAYAAKTVVAPATYAAPAIHAW